MTFEMYEARHDACAALDTDPAVRAVVLRGAGDKAFASGTDIRQFLEFKTRQDALDYEARLTRVLSKLAGMGKAPRDVDDLIVSCYLSRDFHEGVRSFLEKRKPDWQGR